MCKTNTDGSEASWIVCYRDGSVWAEQVCDDPRHWDGGGSQVLASGLDKIEADKIVERELAQLAQGE